MRTSSPAVVAAGCGPPSTARVRVRVLVVGRAAGTLGGLIRPFAATVRTCSVSELLRDGALDTDVLVLHTRAPVPELTALGALAGALPPVLVVARELPPGQVVPALRAGALSLLVQGQFSTADLREAIFGTANGQSRLSPTALSTVVDHVRHRADPATQPEPLAPRQPLSRREWEIMDLIAAGEANVSIAARLNLAEKTVRNRVSQIYLKLRVRNRTEAIVYWRGRSKV
jgi:DNA-binding NarL/FixJ family response regulator